MFVLNVSPSTCATRYIHIILSTPSPQTSLLGSDGGRSTEWCFAAREKLMRDAKIFIAKNFEPALERELKKRKAVSAEMIALRTGGSSNTAVVDEVNQVPQAAAEEMAVSVLYREMDRIARNHGKGTAAVKLVKCTGHTTKEQTEDKCEPVSDAEEVTLVAGSAYMSSWAASIPNTRILPLLPESGIVSLETNTKIALCDSLDNWVAERSSASTGLGARLSNVLTEYSTMSRKGEQFGDRALRGFFTSEFERKVSTEILTPDNLEKFLKEQVGKWKCKDVQKSRKESRTVETRHEQQQEQPPSRARTITEQVQF